MGPQALLSSTLTPLGTLLPIKHVPHVPMWAPQPLPVGQGVPATKWEALTSRGHRSTLPKVVCQPLNVRRLPHDAGAGPHTGSRLPRGVAWGQASGIQPLPSPGGVGSEVSRKSAAWLSGSSLTLTTS